MSDIATKLEYLNTTKEKIRDSINLTGANIGTSDTFRSYATKLKKGYIDIINNGIDTLYNNFPKVSGIGSNLSLTPTYEAPMKLNEIQGNTLQNGTPTPNTPVEIQSVTGLQNVEVCGKNLCFNITKPSNANLRFFINKSISKTFTISFTTNEALNGNSLYLEVDGTSYGNIGGITASANTKVEKTYTLSDANYQAIQDGTNIDLLLYKNGANFNIPDDGMVENNSTATSYEPYKGNTYEVNLGKNLCKEVIMLNVETIRLNANNKYLKQTFSISLIPTITVSQMSVVAFADNKNLGGVGYIDLTNNTKSSATITLTDSVYKTILNAAAVNFNLYKRNAGIDTTSTIKEPQIENGSVTSYSPYFTPIELNKIGDYKDTIKKSTGKNLFDKDNANTLNSIINGNNGTLSAFDTCKTIYIPCKPNTTYAVSKISSTRFVVGTTTNQPTIGMVCNSFIGNNTASSIRITTGENDNYLCVFYYNSGSDTLTEQAIRDTLMIQEGSIVSPYEPYGKVWYVEKNTRKLQANISDLGGQDNYPAFVNLPFLKDDYPNLNSPTFNTTYKTNIAPQNTGIGINTMYVGSSLILNKAYFGLTKTQWLEQYPNLTFTIEYGLSTPTYTEITNTELIEDLETLYTAKSQEGTTNISITSEDLEMILNVSALKGEV